jgi:hypothetical protein
MPPEFLLSSSEFTINLGEIRSAPIREFADLSTAFPDKLREDE